MSPYCHDRWPTSWQSYLMDLSSPQIQPFVCICTWSGDWVHVEKCWLVHALIQCKWAFFHHFGFESSTSTSSQLSLFDDSSHQMYGHCTINSRESSRAWTLCFHLLHQALAICQQTQIPSFSVRWCYLGMKRGVWSQFPNSLFPINSGIKQGKNKKTVQLSKMGTPFWFPFVLMERKWTIAGFFKLATAFLNSWPASLKIMLEYYPGRLHKQLVINPPLLFSCLWNAPQECVMKIFSLDQLGFLLLGKSRKAGVSMSPTTSWYLINDRDHGPSQIMGKTVKKCSEGTLVTFSFLLSVACRNQV